MMATISDTNWSFSTTDTSSQSDESDDSDSDYPSDTESLVRSDSSSSSSYSDPPWIIEHILEPRAPDEQLPLRIMFSFNSGQGLPNLRDVHQWWHFRNDGQKIIAFLSSLDKLDSPKNTASITRTRRSSSSLAEEHSDLHSPYDRFMDPGNEKLLKVALSPEESAARRASKGLPLMFVEKMVLGTIFRTELAKTDFKQALAGLDYLRDYEDTRRCSLREAARRLGITADNWRTILGRNVQALEWVEKVVENEAVVESRYSKIYVNLRIWTMVHELKELNFYKPNVLAMLNTLFPPSIDYTSNMPVKPQVIHKHRASLYHCLVEAEAQSDLLRIETVNNYVKRYLRDGTGYSWPETRAQIEDYMRLAKSMTQQARLVRSIDSFKPQEPSDASRKRSSRPREGLTRFPEYIDQLEISERQKYSPEEGAAPTKPMVPFSALMYPNMPPDTPKISARIYSGQSSIPNRIPERNPMRNKISTEPPWKRRPLSQPRPRFRSRSHSDSTLLAARKIREGSTQLGALLTIQNSDIQRMILDAIRVATSQPSSPGFKVKGPQPLPQPLPKVPIRRAAVPLQQSSPSVSAHSLQVRPKVSVRRRAVTLQPSRTNVSAQSLQLRPTTPIRRRAITLQPSTHNLPVQSLQIRTATPIRHRAITLQSSSPSGSVQSLQARSTAPIRPRASTAGAMPLRERMRIAKNDITQDMILQGRLDSISNAPNMARIVIRSETLLRRHRRHNAAIMPLNAHQMSSILNPRQDTARPRSSGLRNVENASDLADVVTPSPAPSPTLPREEWTPPVNIQETSFLNLDQSKEVEANSHVDKSPSNSNIRRLPGWQGPEPRAIELPIEKKPSNSSIRRLPGMEVPDSRAIEPALHTTARVETGRVRSLSFGTRPSTSTGLQRNGHNPLPSPTGSFNENIIDQKRSPLINVYAAERAAMLMQGTKDARKPKPKHLAAIKTEQQTVTPKLRKKTSFVYAERPSFASEQVRDYDDKSIPQLARASTNHGFFPSPADAESVMTEPPKPLKKQRSFGFFPTTRSEKKKPPPITILKPYELPPPKSPHQKPPLSPYHPDAPKSILRNKASLPVMRTRTRSPQSRGSTDSYNSRNELLITRPYTPGTNENSPLPSPNGSTFMTDTPREKTLVKAKSTASLRSIFRIKSREVIVTSADIDEPLPEYPRTPITKQVNFSMSDINRKVESEKKREREEAIKAGWWASGPKERLTERYVPISNETKDQFQRREFARKWLLEDARAKKTELKSPRGRPSEESQVELIEDTTKEKKKGGVLKMFRRKSEDLKPVKKGVNFSETPEATKKDDKRVVKKPSNGFLGLSLGGRKRSDSGFERL